VCRFPRADAFARHSIARGASTASVRRDARDASANANVDRRRSTRRARRGAARRAKRVATN